MLYCLQWGIVVDFSEFKRKVSAGEIDSIYLFEGEEIFLFDSALADLKEKVVSFLELDFVSLDGDSVTGNSLVPMLTAFPFASLKRLVAVKEFYPNSSDMNALSDYFKNPAPDTVFAIFNSKNCETLKKQKTVNLVKCVKQDAGVIVKWIQRELASFNKTVSNENALKIAEYCLNDMSRVKNETQKMVDFLGDRTVVEKADIESVTVKDSEYRIYEMTEQVGKRDFSSAMLILNEMLAGGEPPQKLITSLYYYYRKLFHIAISDKTEKDLAVELGVKEFAITKMKRQAKAFKVKNLKIALDTLADYDYNFKSGVMNADSALMLGVFKLMTL